MNRKKKTVTRILYYPYKVYGYSLYILQYNNNEYNCFFFPEYIIS